MEGKIKEMSRFEWLKRKHEIKAEVGIVEAHDYNFPTMPPEGVRLIKKWCPSCETGFSIKFPLKCICGGLIHIERHKLWDDYEYRMECSKCHSTWSFDPCCEPLEKELSKFEMLIRKNIIIKSIKDSNIKHKKKLFEHLDKIYYNAPRINYSGFT